jgi:hypothetical protein
VPKKFARDLLARGDGRARHIKDLRGRFGRIVQDLGGPDELSAIELERAQRLAHVEHWLGRIESAARERGAASLPASLMQQYMALLYASLRLGDSLGVKRRARKVESLADYIAAAQSKEPPP